jgi:uncharacterized protein YutE (UPF0331/DUF86 family)
LANFRNIIIHDYTDIDAEIVLDIVKNGINDLQDIFRWYKEYVS